MKDKRIICLVLVGLSLTILSTASAGITILSYDNFDAESHGDAPDNWTLTNTPGNGDFKINNTQYVSSPNSMFMNDQVSGSGKNIQATTYISTFSLSNGTPLNMTADFRVENIGGGQFYPLMAGANATGNAGITIVFENDNNIYSYPSNSKTDTGCNWAVDTWYTLTVLVYFNNDTKSIYLDDSFCDHTALREYGGELNSIEMWTFASSSTGTPKGYMDNLYMQWGEADPPPAGGNETIVTINAPENTTYWSRSIPTRIHIEDTGESTINMSYYYDGTLFYSNQTFLNDTWRNTTSTLGLGSLIGLHNFTIWSNGSYENFTSRFFTVAAYENGTMSYDEAVSEGSTGSYSLFYRINPDAIDNMTAGFWWNETYRGTTTRSTNTSYEIFTNTLVIPEAANLNESVDFLYNITISWANGTVSTINSTTNNQTAQSVQLNNCTGAGDEGLIMYLKDEETDADAAGDIEIAIDIDYYSISKNFSFSWTNITNATICLYPPQITIDFDAQIFYEGTGYYPRTYFLDTTVSNTTQSVYLYLINTSDASQVIIYVKDSSGLAVENATVKVERFYVGDYSYKTVAQIVTDFDGKGVAYLNIDKYYKYIIELNGTVVREFSPSIIVCPSGSSCPPYTVTLYTTESSSTEFSQIYGSISHSCSWNNVTGVLSCTGSDTTGISQEFGLEVDRLGILTDTSECSSTSASSAVTMTCTLTNWSGNTYHYEFLVNLPESGWVVIENGFLDFYSVAYTYGWVGTLAVLVLILATAGMAVNPSAAIILPTVALIFATGLGLVPIEYTVLIELVVIAGVAAYKLRV